MSIELLFVFIVTLILVYAIYSDFSRRQIPNTASVILLVNSTLYCGYLGYWGQWLIVVPVFLFGLLLWRWGIWGAGDAKLLVAVSPMISLDHYVATLLLIATFGGALSVAIFVSSRLKKMERIRIFHMEFQSLWDVG